MFWCSENHIFSHLEKKRQIEVVNFTSFWYFAAYKQSKISWQNLYVPYDSMYHNSSKPLLSNFPLEIASDIKVDKPGVGISVINHGN